MLVVLWREILVAFRDCGESAGAESVLFEIWNIEVGWSIEVVCVGCASEKEVKSNASREEERNIAPANHSVD